MTNKGTGLGHLHYKMMSRCYREKDVMYKDYGAKGIKVCEEWHDRPTFIKWCINNGWQKGLKVNRYDGKKDYCPENCYMGTNMSRNPNSRNQEIKKSIRERKQKKREAGIKGKISEDELYITYHGMHSRCERKSHPSYMNYGGRGIGICPEWSGKHGFFNFKKWAINNGWVEGLSLDRLDNNKGYCPDNCRFATRVEQNYHRRSNIMYEYSGIMMPLGMIAKLEDVKYGLLYTRVRQKGLSVRQALEDIKGGN
jgi:hypothetical protein